VIERQTQELGVHTEGMVGLVLGLLTLRDPAFARHAAAVAHHARGLAAVAGMSEREQDVVHAAGLLHDIGRQGFADTLLGADAEVDDGGRRAIRRHPQVGAQLLRSVPGMWEVADAIEAHHERIDGTGYPHGLADGRIPRAARMVAVAEVYDVLTAEDTYRGRRDHAWAAQELRRVAGTQLDARLVELFLTAVPHAGRRPSLEDELPALRTAFGLLGPRPAAG
jgi:putative nucleotidyltransferase with HDIG domain